MEIKVGDVVKIISLAGAASVTSEGKLVKATDMYSDIQVIENGREYLRRVMNQYILCIEKVITQ